ncbi:MAG: hypothetical protein IPF59_13975 [Ignavibacteria bacterium]|nr:hypothetical protein [Ignavibacteria bacterium]
MKLLWKKTRHRDRRQRLAKRRFNRTSNAINTKRRTARVRGKTHKVRVSAPSSFDISRHPQEVASFIHDLAAAYARSSNVVVDLKSVESLTPESLFVLQSFLLNRDFYHGANRKGTFPSNLEVNTLMKESGFVGMLTDDTDAYTSSDQSSRIIFTQDTKADGELVAKIIRDAHSRLQIGEIDELDYESSYAILMELIGNVTEHAGGEERLSQKWYLFSHSNPKTRSVSFTFLDHGIGVFASLKPKVSRQLWHLLIKKNRVTLLRRMFEGLPKKLIPVLLFAVRVCRRSTISIERLTM